ncbi:MAG: universal stress protein [Acidimicrobiia bacterium]|nr:universal stress protein [Acidimicrobiia bacterium]
MFSKILVPVDLEDSSRAGVEMAAALAGESNGKILAVHVMTSASFDVSDVPHEAKPLREQAEQKAKTLIDDLMSEVAPGIDSETYLFFGDPSAEIVQAANALDADLIVVTVKNKSRLGKLLMGSQNQEIILTAGKPVLCVPKG